MSSTPFRQRGLFSWFYLLAFLFFMGASSLAPAQATPPIAGSSILNRAEVTFDVEGQSVRLDSNIVSVTVLPVEDLTLTADNDISQPPGAPAYLPHRLTNTGNIATNYTLDISNLSGDDYDLSDLVLYRDVNGNGTPDVGEPTISNLEIVALAPGQSSDLVIAANIPSATLPELAARIQIIATSTSTAVTASNTDTIRTQAGVTVDIKKSASPQSTRRGEEVAFTIVATSKGTSAPSALPVTVDGASQNLVIVRDVIPANTTFVAIDDPGFGTRLYHRFGDPLHTYSATAPANLDEVDAVAVGAFVFPANGTLQLKFRVRVSNVASGTLSNIARIFYNDVTADQVRDTPSNIVFVALPAATPALRFYTDDSYRRIAPATGIGRLLYLQAGAAACNQSPTEIERIVITVTSRLTGDSVRYTAIETGPNTGLFRVTPPIPTSGDTPNAGNDVLEVQANDTLTGRFSDCGGGEEAVASILIDPFGVVFDARTNAPIAGATVTLIDVTGAGNGGNAGGPAQVFEFDGVTLAPSTVLTGVDGEYEFPQVAESTYRLVVTPPPGYIFPSQIPVALLPVGRLIDTPGSFGGEFAIDVDAGALQIDVPLDPPAPSGFFVEKTASRRVVEIADWVDYRIRIRNNSGIAIFDATLRDVLPRGFALQEGSVKFDGVKVEDPSGAPGPNLIFALGAFAPNKEIVVTYRVRVGAGARLGDNRNRAQATGTIVGGTISSNIASAKVTVQAGVFTTRGIILGKVFVDANGNKIQDKGEDGIPGVRIYLEDGTYAITDGEGKYSIYGVSARTHNVKLDTTTMPRDSVLKPLSVKHAGSGSSCFADMTNGELQKVNFAESSASEEILKIVKERRERAAKADLALAETDAINTDLNPDGPNSTPGDTRSLPASGTKTSTGLVSSENTGAGNGRVPPTGYGTVPPLQGTRETFGGQVPRTALDGPLDGYAAPPVAAAPSTSSLSLEEVLTGLNSELGFVDFKDKDTLSRDQVSVRVKGAIGSRFELLVNGAPVPDSRLGSKSTFAEEKIEAWEWIGVRFKTGLNTLEVREKDSFGNTRGTRQITVVAPGQLAKLQVTSDKAAYAADGQTLISIRVRLADEKGVLVSARTPITLESSAGLWRVEDLNKTEPGVQVFLEGGEAGFQLLSPAEPADALVRASSGSIESTLRLSFMPELRPLLASGVLDAKVGFGFNAKSVRRAGVGDSFDDDLRKFADSGNIDLGVRGALFLKGRIQGKYLLTLRYESEKEDDDQRLFRDIQPDEYYPVFGDASIKGFDAQSTGRMYVRVDKDHSYVLYGDFTTLDASDAQTLARYSRSFTGVKLHHETNRFSGTAFFSRDNSRRAVEEIRGAGISGPYFLSDAAILENSEKVEIIVRDRNQPSVVLSITPQSRFSDYTIDGLTDGLLFRAPVPSYDADLNPVFIRVAYEVEQGGPKFDVMGLSGQFKLTKDLQVGGSWVKDENPEDATTLRSINAIYRLSQSTVIVGEWAQSERDDTGSGHASRFEVLHNGRNLQARFLMGRSSDNFDNPESLLNRGRSETSLRGTYRLGERTRLAGEIIRTEDNLNNVKLTGAQASFERAFSDKFRGSLGIRHASGQAETVSGGGNNANVDFTSLFARLNMQVSPKANLFARYEKSLTSESQSFAIGGDYQVAARTRTYLVHEFLDSPDGLYALNENSRTYRTRFGVETDYMKNGHAFGEYRTGNGIDGASAQAAFGLRNQWPLGRGLRLSTLFERTKSLGDGATTTGLASDGNATTAAVGLEWLRGENFKATARLEGRNGDNFDSVLQTMGLAYKPGRDWTLLMRNAYTKTKNSDGDDRTQQRFQVGVAFRQTETDRIHALAKYEYRSGEDGSLGSGFSGDSQRKVHIVSLDGNYQPSPGLSVRLHYAMKRATEEGNGAAISAQLFSGRIVKEVSPRTELSLILSTLNGKNPDSNRYGVGFEVSRTMAQNLSLSIGYNFFELRDNDLMASGEGRRGAYLRMRFKFDEGSFNGLGVFRKPASAPSGNSGFIPVAESSTLPAVGIGNMRGGSEF